MGDVWEPAQYQRFKEERGQPFRDLLALVEPRPGMSVVDLGCGTGEPTHEMHTRLRARETVGVDSSAAMIETARAQAAPGLRFELGSIEEFLPAEPVDLVFSNAALHWVPEHGTLLRKLASWLLPEGQLAVQMPANDAHPSHETAAEVALEPIFRRALDGWVRRPPVLEPAQYAAWLNHLGFRRQHVRVQVYGHLLESRESVVEWVKGTLLTDYKKRLPLQLWAPFLARYRELLLPRLEDTRPFFYPYPRILFWGRR